MKIVMLGHSGVGKTTFMACMYAALQSPVDGFAIVAEEEDLHHVLYGIAEAVVEGRYPAATSALSEYPLILLFEDEAVLEFEWIDYRGNALNEKGSTAEFSSLQDHLDEADGIIMFFDGVEVSRGGRAARAAIGRLMVLLQNAINTQEGILPVALVVTKADLLEDNEEILEQLMPLISAINQSQNIHGALIYTACGMNMLANVTKPTLFVLHKGIFGKLERLRTEFEAMTRQGQDYESRAGFFDWVSSKLEGLPTFGEMAQRQYDNANQLIRQHNQLVEPANGLGSTLTDIEMF